VPALQPYLIEPILWEQFRALLPECPETNHPLGCLTVPASLTEWSSRSSCKSWCSGALTLDVCCQVLMPTTP
jgi:hypothetical protein